MYRSFGIFRECSCENAGEEKRGGNALLPPLSVFDFYNLFRELTNYYLVMITLWLELIPLPKILIV